MNQQKTIVAAALLAGALALLLGVNPAQGAPAQQANLLNNGSMEGGSRMVNNDGDWRGVPNAWDPWYNKVENEDCNKAFAKPHYEMEAHPSHVKDGMWSARYWTDARMDAGLMQTVAATPGTKYKFSIYVFNWTVPMAQAQPDVPSKGEQMVQVGMDPAGGTNGGAASVVWGAETWQYDSLILLTVEATATANKITVFTRTRPNWCGQRNDSFWDAGTVVATGQGPTPVPAGGKTAVPTKPSTWGVQSGSIITATPQPDGSIIHTVSSGESCTGIAVAYNISLDDLYSQNSLSNDKCRFISPGQKLTIRPPQQPTPAPATPTPETTAVAEEPSEEVAPPQDANGTICVMGFEDENSNGIPEPVEPKLAGMTFEVSNGTQVIGTYTTDALSEPYCFAQVPPGAYVVSWTGEALAATTEQSWSITLEPGTTVSRQFGAQPASEAANGQTGSNSGPEQGGGLPAWAMALLLAIGVMLLLSGMGVAGYFVLMRRAKI